MDLKGRKKSFKKVEVRHAVVQNLDNQFDCVAYKSSCDRADTFGKH